MKRIPFVVAVIIWFALSSTSACAGTLYLSVAASMTDAFREIITEFTKHHPETRILPNFASSGSLAKQIAQGAPADLYVSANPKWMEFLVKEKVIAESTKRIFAFNTLVFVGLSETAVSELGQIVSLKKISIGSPQSVPAGQYAKQAMEGAGIYSKLEEGKVLVMAKDVRQALLYADRGEVDGSFVYKTDAMLAKNAKILFTVPGELYDRVSYPMALTAAGAEKQEAQGFFSFMATGQAISILKKHGFDPAQ